MSMTLPLPDCHSSGHDEQEHESRGQIPNVGAGERAVSPTGLSVQTRMDHRTFPCLEHIYPQIQKTSQSVRPCGKRSKSCERKPVSSACKTIRRFQQLEEFRPNEGRDDSLK
jgi:hypothetical protein